MKYWMDDSCQKQFYTPNNHTWSKIKRISDDRIESFGLLKTIFIPISACFIYTSYENFIVLFLSEL